ncbi:MAG: hypothetical protein EOP34_03310 [Rickettsiales bacterium]|nr:MAG: hypothetical protein EOP34_03310 [Rickettsiales bacterium]
MNLRDILNAICATKKIFDHMKYFIEEKYYFNIPVNHVRTSNMYNMKNVRLRNAEEYNKDKDLYIHENVDLSDNRTITNIIIDADIFNNIVKLPINANKLTIYNMIDNKKIVFFTQHMKEMYVSYKNKVSKNTYDVREKIDNLTIRGRCQIEIKQLPSHMNYLEIEAYSINDDVISFSQIKIKTMKIYCSKRINITEYPLSLVHLVLGHNFNDLVDNLPKSLKCLQIDSKFNQPIDNLPNGIDHIILGGSFNNNLDKLPTNLKKLQLGCSFDKKLDNLPRFLEYLEIYGSFDQTIDKLPPSLKALKISFRFNKSIDYLPKNLEFLYLYGCFNNNISNLSPNLKYLFIQGNFDQDVDYLPAGLSLLSISGRFYRMIKNIPSSLLYLSLPDIIDIHVPPKTDSLRVLHRNIEKIDVYNVFCEKEETKRLDLELLFDNKVYIKKIYPCKVCNDLNNYSSR